MADRQANDVQSRVGGRKLAPRWRLVLIAFLGVILLTVGWLAVLPAPAQASGVLIVAPHPDDDIIYGAGIVYAAQAAGKDVKVVYMTNGDYLGTWIGWVRQDQAVLGQSYLDNPESNLIFLGYPDGYLREILKYYPGPSEFFTTPAGQSTTYGDRGLDGADYHTGQTGSAASYNAANIRQDLDSILAAYRPDDIYTTSGFDVHPDHATTFNFVKNAVMRLKTADGYSPTLHTTVVWNLLPQPLTSADPMAYLSEPPGFSSTGLVWADRQSIEVPLAMQSTDFSTNPKYLAMNAHQVGSGGGATGDLGSFIRKDEVFWLEALVNNPPTANAGADQTVASAATVHLNGALSSDPDGNPITYQWTQVGTPTVTLSDATAAQPTFTAPVGPATLTFQLVVSDGLLSSSPDTVTVTVKGPPPAEGNIALYAGVTASSQRTATGQLATSAVDGVVDGYGGSPGDYTKEWVAQFGDLAGAWLRLTWTTPQTVNRIVLHDRPNVSDQVTGATISFSDGTSLITGPLNNDGSGVTITFSAKTITSLEFRVDAVSIGTTFIGLAEIEVWTPTHTPVANAGADQTVASEASVQLDGVTSWDPDGDTITYEWTQVGTPTVTLSDATAAQPTFTAPVGPATLTFQLVVSDGLLSSSPDSVTVGVNPPNNPPTANAGADQTVASAATVHLNGALSSDPDGNPITYQWTQVGTPTVTLSDATAAQPTFTAPVGPATLTFQLVVSDGLLSSSPDTVTVTVKGPPPAEGNIALYAGVTASSQRTATGQLATSAVDGVVDGYGGSPGDYTKEWVAQFGDLAGAWLRLTWTTPQTVNRIVLHDRPNVSDQVTGATISFSDGTSLITGPLNNDGSGVTITFSAKTITSLEFRVDAVSIGTTFIGLAEIEVWTPILSTVSGLSPTSGPAAGSNQVIITGTNFLDASVVKFGSASAAFTVNSATQITVASAPGGSGTVHVTVETPGGTSTTGSADQYTYYALPSVSGLSPTSGPAAGSNQVIITGTNFLDASVVKFGSASAAFTVNSATQITVASAPGGSGTVHVTVETPGGTSTTGSADQYTYYALPSVSGLSPTSGPAAGSNQVIITGTNFLDASVVKFGSASAAFTVNSATQITVASAPGGSGTVHVTVETPGGTSTTGSADQYTYYALPSVSGLSPTSGPAAGSNQVIITGTNFLDASVVKFGSASAAFTVNSATQITVASAPGGSGTVHVTVETPGGTSTTGSADQYTYYALPSVSGLSPTSGPAAGSNQVIITGTNFLDASVVKFGSASAAFTVNSATQITVASAPGGSGTVHVTVETPGGTSTTGSADQYTYYALPSVSGLSPTSGPAAGSNQVIITGTNFLDASVVKFGSASAAFTVNSATQITVASAPGGSGTVHVTVETPGGTSTTGSADQYTYYALPSVSGLSPTSGPAAGSNQVIITGTNFLDASVVKFGSASAAFTVNSATQITVASAPGGSGTVHVTVETPGGTSTTGSADQYTYYALPTIRYEETDPLLIYSGSWANFTSSSYSAGGMKQTSINGSTVTINFTGTKLTWITRKFPSSGRARVTLDGGTPVTVDLYSPTQLYQQAVWTTGTLANGNHKVVIAYTGQKNPSATFTYVNIDAVDVTGVLTGAAGSAPAITSVSPSSGPAIGGSGPVTITGTNFTGASAVAFGPTAVPLGGFTVSTSSQIVVTNIPPGTGTVDVRVTTPAGPSAIVLADQYTYAAAVPAPTITLVNPATGPAIGGAGPVTITGTNFTGATAVTFGLSGVLAGGFSVVNSTTISVTNIPGGTGTVDVRVTTPGGGTSAIVTQDKYTYLPPVVPAPTITNISPISGPALGGSGPVTITGTNFTGATGVTFGLSAVLAGGFTVNSSSQITVTNIPSGTGTVDVRVTTPGGGTSAIVTADQYTYLSTVRYEETDSHLIYSGSWATFTGASYSAGSMKQTSINGSTVTIKFTGTSLTWITRKFASSGRARVTLDGGTPVTVDLYSATQLYQQPVWTTGTLTNGPHTVVISWTGLKNPAATFTYVNIDAVDVTGVLN